MDGAETVGAYAGRVSRSPDHLFVLRTWLEAPNDLQTMRGQLDHVASGRRQYFANFGDLCDFIAGTHASVAPASELAPADDPARER
jgi:hypothetical protein